MGGRRKLFKKFTNAWSRNTNVIGYTTANKMTQCYSFHYTYSQHLLCSYIVSQLNFQIESNYMHVYISLHWNQQAARMWRKWFPVVMIKLFTERMLDFAHIEALFCYYFSTKQRECIIIQHSIRNALPLDAIHKRNLKRFLKEIHQM